MNLSMLWYIGPMPKRRTTRTPAELEEAVTKAGEYFLEKYKIFPNVCRAHAGEFEDPPRKIGPITLTYDRATTAGHLLIGREEKMK